MTTEVAVWLAITGIRVLLPLSILRWPLGGAIACIVADTYDHTVFRHVGFGPFGGEHYQQWDKLLDIWYLLFAFWITRSWTNALARKTARLLFLWRLLGVAVFEALGWRHVLVLAPNIFENFFLFWLVAQRWFPFRLTRRNLVVVLLVVAIPKVIQEILAHWLYPDQGIIDTVRALFG